MNETEQRIKLAEFEEWNVVHSYGHSEFAKVESNIWHLRKGNELKAAFAWNDFRGKLGAPTLADCAQSLPDYHRDFKACHELEKKLTGDQWRIYLGFLGGKRTIPKLMSMDEFQECWNKDEPQRCEALLRTIGQWTETPQPERTV